MKVGSVAVAGIVAVLCLVVTVTFAKGKGEVGEGGVVVNLAGQTRNEVGNVAGEIDEDAQIEGVAVVNGVVSIDGVRVPRGQKSFRSRSGKSYVIEWGRDGNVSVVER